MESFKKELHLSMDRISSLPDAICHHILSFLPIEAIAQTSVLSKRWNFLWLSIPHLDFSKRHYWKGTLSSCRDAIRDKVMKSVPLILDRRHEHSQIKSFLLKGELGSPCLLHCFRSLLNHKLEQLELDVSLSDPFDLPPSLFTLESLKGLEIRSHKGDHNFRFSRFAYDAIAASAGLVSLVTLSLKSVRFMVGNLFVEEDLFSAACFPHLEKLSLNDCDGIAHLTINCPNLKDLRVHYLQIYGLDISGRKLEELEIEDCFYVNGPNYGAWVKIFAPRLKTFHWSDSGIPERCSVQKFPEMVFASFSVRYTGGNFVVKSAIKLLGAFCDTRKLIVGYGKGTTELLSDIHLEGGLPYSFDNLQSLSISTSLEGGDIPGVACILGRAPKVKDLCIDIFGFWEESDDWNEVGNASFSAPALRSFLHHLEVVKIDVWGDMIPKNVINLVKFLLKRGHALQKMKLSSQGDWAFGGGEKASRWKKIFGRINKFSRASPNVDVVLV